MKKLAFRLHISDTDRLRVFPSQEKTEMIE